jgi:hypothetical protein
MLPARRFVIFEFCDHGASNINILPKAGNIQKKKSTNHIVRRSDIFFSIQRASIGRHWLIHNDISNFAILFHIFHFHHSLYPKVILHPFSQNNFNLSEIIFTTSFGISVVRYCVTKLYTSLSSHDENVVLFFDSDMYLASLLTLSVFTIKFSHMLIENLIYSIFEISTHFKVFIRSLFGVDGLILFIIKK